MKNSALKWLRDVIGKKKWYIPFLLSAQAVYGGSGILYAVYLRNVIDSATEMNGQGFIKNVILIITLVVLQIVMRAVMRHAEEKAKSTYENLIKKRLFSNLLKKEYASVTAIHSGEWINRLTNDTVVCANGLVEILPGMVGMIVKLLGALVMILMLQPGFAFILFPGGALMFLLTYGFRKILKRLHKSIQEKDGKIRIYIQEILSSLVIVRTFAAENQSIDESYKRMEEHQKSRMKRNHFSNVCNIGFAAAMNGMYLFGLIYGGNGIMTGKVSYGTLTALLQLISQIQSPFANITGYIPKYYSMTASAERIMEVERFNSDSDKEIISFEEIRRFYDEKMISMKIENADFTYMPPTTENTDEKHKMPVVMKNISIEVRKGEYTAFTGHSGCGKSTLLKLFMCLYGLDSGERFIVSDESIPLTSRWRRLFAYVPQGNHLMSGSVREIVSFSDRNSMNDDDRINKALEISCSDEFVNNLEQGKDTVLGERGAGLSEGQMQRIAIARAVFSDAPVLMLDESTSALDEETERKVLENIRSMTDKTVMIVTHRPMALEICDSIYEFTENGIIKRK